LTCFYDSLTSKTRQRAFVSPDKMGKMGGAAIIVVATAPPEVSAGGHAIITIPGKANTLTHAPLSQFDPFQQVRASDGRRRGGSAMVG
jgi:hypothetical protein